MTDAMKRSGHTDPKVFHRHYPKVDPASSTRRISALHEAYWEKRNGTGSDQDGGNLKDAIIQAVRELPEDEKKALGRALLQELMA